MIRVYDSNETFSTTANNNGTTGGELVSYNYYNGLKCPWVFLGRANYAKK